MFRPSGDGLPRELRRGRSSTGELYVSGEFTEDGGSPGNNIAKWNGVSWSGLRKGLRSGSTEIVVSGVLGLQDNLMAVGLFTSADDVAASKIAKWDGSKWCAAGTLYPAASAICEFKGDVYVGGAFNMADGDTAIKFLAKWTGPLATDACSSFLDIKNEAQALPIVLPIPATDKIYVHSVGWCDAQIFALDGRLVCQKKHIDVERGIDVNDLAPGIYFLKLTNSTGTMMRKFEHQ